MEKINQYLVKFAKYYSPIIAIAIALDLMGYNSSGSEKTFANYLFDIAGWIGIAWCVVVIYLFFAIALNEKLKNSFVRWLAGIRENDERETYLTGVVSKRTFITVTGSLVLLLFLSALQVTIYRVPEEKKTPEKNGAIMIGMGFPLLAETKKQAEEITDQDRIYIVNYKGIPLTSGATLLLITVLQVGAFYYYSRREIKSSKA